MTAQLAQSRSRGLGDDTDRGMTRRWPALSAAFEGDREQRALSKPDRRARNSPHRRPQERGKIAPEPVTWRRHHM